MTSPLPSWADEASAMWKAQKPTSFISDALDIDRKAIIRLSLKRRDMFPERTPEQRRALISMGWGERA